MNKKKVSQPVQVVVHSEDDIAKAVHSQHIAFIEAGFTSEQSFELTKMKFANFLQTTVTVLTAEEVK